MDSHFDSRLDHPTPSTSSSSLSTSNTASRNNNNHDNTVVVNWLRNPSSNRRRLSHNPIVVDNFETSKLIETPSSLSSSFNENIVNVNVNPFGSNGNLHHQHKHRHVSGSGGDNESTSHLRPSPSAISNLSQVGLNDNSDANLDDRDDTPPSSNGGEDIHTDTPVALKQRVGLLSGTALIVGTMIGSGIFISPKGLLERTGSVGSSLIVWAGCGGLSMLGALSYAELGTMIVKSGAEYSYFLEAYGSLWAFLFSWVSIFVLKPSMLAIICLSFAEYVVQGIMSGCQTSPLAIKMMGAATVGIITYLNCQSVKLSTWVQNFFTGAKLLAIIIIVIGGGVKLAQGNTQHLSTGFHGTSSSWGDIATAFYSGLWAYDGWNNLNYVTEEIRNPFVNLPRAIILGLPLVTVCYILVNIAYLAAMSVDELLASEAVAVTFGDRVLGSVSWCIPLFVACSTFGAANGSCFTGGRLCYVAAREGHLVDVLSYVHVKKYTPTPALAFNAVIALLMIIPGDIGSLIDFFSFTAWIFYGGAMLALLVLRRTQPDLPRPYKVPTVVPTIVLIVSVYLVIAPILDDPQVEYLYATTFILAGLVFYVPFVYYKIQWGYMNKITSFLQLLLEVVPEQSGD